MYGGFGARGCPEAGPEESELAVTSDAVGGEADFGEGRLRYIRMHVYVYTG